MIEMNSHSVRLFSLSLQHGLDCFTIYIYKSQNTVSVLAKETGNIDLFELKEDLAYNLQICDQLTYDNAFVYYQPGNGKFKIKEPQQLSIMAMKQIQQIIDIIMIEPE